MVWGLTEKRSGGPSKPAQNGPSLQTHRVLTREREGGRVIKTAKPESTRGRDSTCCLLLVRGAKVEVWQVREGEVLCDA